MSIRLRTILVLNLFGVGLAVVMGYVSRETAGRVVEERLAAQLEVGVAAFLESKNYPLSDTMMGYLRDIFHTDWVAVEVGGNQGLVSSLPAASVQELHAHLEAIKATGQARLGSQLYRVPSKSITRRNAGSGESERYDLFMLVPDAQLKAARDEAAARMFKVFVPSLAVATVVASVFAFTLTRPLSRLVKEMDDLADQAVPTLAGGSGGETAESVARPAKRGVREIVHLTESFRRLLHRLAVAQQGLARHERLATLGKVCVSVAHEIRNPLSGIKMNVRVLEDGLGDTADKETLGVILREIERLDLYLQELMALSRGASAKANAGSPQKLSELSEGILAILAGRCRHAAIEVQRFYPASEPLVWGHADDVRQAMMNLLVNAIEAMPEGGILRVGIAPTAAKGARFCVTDTGAGVHPLPGQDIFEAFVSGKPNGVGLGLYLAREAIERNGGRLGYTTSPGGAEFWFELPGTQVKG